MSKTSEIASEAPYDRYLLPLTTQPMKAKSATDLPADGEGQFEPKWDGFRCLVFKDGPNVDLRAKSGKALGRYFPEVVTFFQSMNADHFVIDGELVIEIDGHLSFDALQMRLHPAESRIRKLSYETPARYVMFDILATPEGDVVTGQSLSERRTLLERFAGAAKIPKQIQLSPMTQDLDLAKRWLEESGPNGTDGVIAKPLAEPYLFGERAMRKVACAQPTASWADFAMRVTVTWLDRCCWDCSMMRANSTTWASHRQSRTTSASN